MTTLEELAKAFPELLKESGSKYAGGIRTTMKVANDNDCCTEAIEILSDIWENVQPLPIETFNRIGGFLVAKGVIDGDVEITYEIKGEDL